MSRKYKIRDQDQLYFVTFSVIRWLDVFIRNEYKDIFMDSLKYCQKQKGLEVFAYCIMTSHVHLIIGRNGDEPLQAIIRDLKKFTSNNIIEAIDQNQQESRKDWLMYFFQNAGRINSSNFRYQFWQQRSHPLELNSNKKALNYLNYIHQNPVKAGFVFKPEDYVYSSATNYAGLPDTLIDVNFIE